MTSPSASSGTMISSTGTQLTARDLTLLPKSSLDGTLFQMYQETSKYNSLSYTSSEQNRTGSRLVTTIRLTIPARLSAESSLILLALQQVIGGLRSSKVTA